MRKKESEQEPVIELRHVDFNKASKHNGLNDVSLMVRKGEILGIAGVDGNGQSQLSRIVTGVAMAEAVGCPQGQPGSPRHRSGLYRKERVPYSGRPQPHGSRRQHDGRGKPALKEHAKVRILRPQRLAPQKESHTRLQRADARKNTTSAVRAWIRRSAPSPAAISKKSFWRASWKRIPTCSSLSTPRAASTSEPPAMCGTA